MNVKDIRNELTLRYENNLYAIIIALEILEKLECIELFQTVF